MLENPVETRDDIVQWIRNYFHYNGPNCTAVIGISGGKDSTIAAALCVEALGKDRVFGVLMPNGYQPDMEDSYRVCEILGIRYTLVNIFDTVDAMYDAVFPFESEQMKTNIPPRIRMAALYAIAQSLPNGGRVVNTCNLSEDYVGYSTKFGDNAGDFSPLGNLTVSKVKQIGYELPIPRELVDKTPADGLCGKTDEDNLGVTYAEIDQYIEYGTTGDPFLDEKISAMHRKNLHKTEPMPKYEEGTFLF